jgi:hypothetical protein
MRWALALSLVLLAVPARAEPLDLLLTNLDETTMWSLEVDVAPGVLARTILLEASPSLGLFTPSPGVFGCCQIAMQQLLPNGRSFLLLTALQAEPLVPAGERTLLGSFAAATDSPLEVELVGADVSAGATALDPAGVSLAYSIRVVPEPALGLLLLLAAALISGRRLTAP